MAEEVTVEEKVRRYIVDLARETRQDGRTDIGISPRGVQRIFELVRAAAVVDGREYVVPDDVKRMADLMMAHRLVLTTEATVEGVDPVTIVDRAVNAVDVPAGAPGPDEPAGATKPAEVGPEDSQPTGPTDSGDAVAADDRQAEATRTDGDGETREESARPKNEETTVTDTQSESWPSDDGPGGSSQPR